MSLLQAIVLGVVQGLTEFLPVSSSGHLVLFQRLFGLREGVLTFDIALHLATLAAVLAVFREDVAAILKKPFGKLTGLIVVGTVPAVVVGLAFKDLFENLFESGESLGVEFLFTAAVLWWVESVRTRHKRLDRTTAADALWVGTAQAVAILPAVSRSGLTIAGALFRGLDREWAARFSFLLSVPAILGAAVLDLPDAARAVRSSGGLGVSPVGLALGMAAALVFGWIAIRWMLAVLRRGSLRGFAVYVAAVGVLVLVDQFFFNRFFPPLF
jgi:undecaprenyl-diphosphatase